jgi:hypothetical protein
VMAMMETMACTISISLLNDRHGQATCLLGGGSGDSERITTFIGPVAAARGVSCHRTDLFLRLLQMDVPRSNNRQRVLDCFGDAYSEVATGIEKSPSDGGDRTSVGQHPQDSIANRLLRVLQWASANKPGDGWDKYLINGTAVNWSEIISQATRMAVRMPASWDRSTSLRTSDASHFSLVPTTVTEVIPRPSGILRHTSRTRQLTPPRALRPGPLLEQSEKADER